jgi:putative transposase
VYHVLNRAVARLPLFEKVADYEAFERVLAEAHQRHPMRILAYAVMPNHWHFVLWPRADGELTAFLRWMTHTHTMRWHASHQTVGTGHLYQGRFKAFPVQRGRPFGGDRWAKNTAVRLGLQYTLRTRGRPKRA